MIYRIAHDQIIDDIQFFPALAIIGPRQVGKTTLARNLRIPSGKPLLYLDLEWEEDRAKLSDAGAYLLQHEDKCVIIDEVQIMPSLFQILRSLVDRKREPARFILLGSASPELLRNSAESLAGRIAYHELCPFSLLEIWEENILRRHWFCGGFPNAFLAPSEQVAGKWLQQFYTTYIERDITHVIGRDVNSAKMLRFVRMLAHIHGNILNLSELSNSMNIATQTLSSYLDLLEGSFLIRRLEPFYVNVGKRLTKSPKFYFRDSGFYHAVARFRDMEDLYASPAIGASWEGYVIEEIFRIAGNHCEYYFYRTQNGAEIDLLLITPRSEKVCIEIKAANAPKISRGFHHSVADLQPEHQYVITPESERYQRSDGIVMIGLYHFLKYDLPLLIS
ncbi:MAG TPA: ATP-binding protein [Saprospiraceae bacterium]|nr:ATP-binding protein [Saprospiraceae bacterium]HRK80051.1 ATP-binding protein [Saprospiraceae bacterium]